MSKKVNFHGIIVFMVNKIVVYSDNGYFAMHGYLYKGM